MAASTRILAENVIFKLPTTDYACDLVSIEFATEDAPGGVRTFCEMQNEQQFKATLTGIASGDAASLYQLLWNNYGTTAAFTVAPQGNASPSTSAPHWEGTMKFDALPPLNLTSGEAVQFSVALTVVNTVHDPANDIFWGLERVTA